MRFLAWYLLKEDIQGGGEKGHDSVEDARTAVRLWRKWEELGRQRGEKGREKVVEDVYRVGRRWGFKPPPPPPPMVSARKEIEGKGRVTPPMMGGGMLAVTASPFVPPPPPTPTRIPPGGMTPPPPPGGGGGGGGGRLA